MTDQIKYTNKLSKKRILIFGASSGIGYALTEALLEHDALILASSSNPTRLATALSNLASAYPTKRQNLHGATIDLSNLDTLEQEAERVFREAVEKIGGEDAKLDHVIYTAGDALRIMPVSSITVEASIKAGAVRFFAPLLLAKYVGRYLCASPSSSYTVTTGSISERPMEGWSVVAAFAGGLHSMVRNLAVDLRPVRVNGVSPGAVDTELWAGMGEAQRERTFRRFEERLLTGEVGKVEDVVEAYLGLLKNRNATGSMVRSDGGGLIV